MFKVGDEVRITDRKTRKGKETTYGTGSVSPKEAGTVTNLRQDSEGRQVYIVNFPRHKGWWGAEIDLVLHVVTNQSTYNHLRDIEELET